MPKINSLEVVHQDTNADKYDNLHDLLVKLKKFYEESASREVVDGEARAAYEVLMEMYVNDKEAFARRVETLSAKFENSLAQVIEEMLAYASASEAYAKKITTVSAEAANANASVQTEAYARAAQDEALATLISTVEARLDTGDFATVKEYAEASVRKNRTYSQTTEPTGTEEDPLVEGDVWYDTDNDNKQYRYSLTVVTKTIAAVNQVTEQLQVIGHGFSTGTEVTYIVGSGGTAIGGLVADTKYYAIVVTADVIRLATTLDNANNNIAINITAAGTGTQTLYRDVYVWADSTIPTVTTFSQASSPTAKNIGDIWYDTDDYNKPYRWNGSSWILSEDGRIPLIQAKWGVTVNANGNVAGIELISGANTQSSFTVDATKFIVKKPNGTNGIAWNGALSRLDISGEVYADAFYGTVIGTNNLNLNTAAVGAGNVVGGTSATQTTVTFTIAGLSTGETVPVLISTGVVSNVNCTMSTYIDSTLTAQDSYIANQLAYIGSITALGNGTHTAQLETNITGSGQRRLSILVQVIKR